MEDRIKWPPTKASRMDDVCRNIRNIYVSLIEKSDLNGKMQSTFGFRASVDEVLQARIETKENDIQGVS